jgi:CHAT domain-containing protein
MVAEPCAPGFTQLDNVVKEVNKVAEMLEQSSVARVDVQIGEAASMDAVTGRLADANVVHFAAHGTQNVTAPLQSGFCLRDGLLTVSSLMRIRTKQAIFAFLSACETAKGDKDQPDQVVHLAAALLYVGFRSLVATMWYVFFY